MIDSITTPETKSDLKASTLKLLSDDELWSHTARVADREKCATLELLDHLLEVDARRLFAKRAYPSLFAYVTQELGYSEAQASERIGAMRLMRDVEGAKTKVESGSLTLTSAAVIQRTLRKSKKLMGSTVTKEEQVLIVEACERKSSREVERVLASHFPESVTHPEKTRPLTAEYDELRFVIDRETRELLDELRTIRGVESLAEVFKEALRARLSKLRPVKPQPEKSAPEMSAPAKLTWAPTSVTAEHNRNHAKEHAKTPLKRYIPAHIRSQVRERSLNRCEYQDKQAKRRCLSQVNLQFEHHQPFAKGGTHSTQNVLHFCAEHNRLRAIEEYGARKMNQYLKRQ